MGFLKQRAELGHPVHPGEQGAGVGGWWPQAQSDSRRGGSLAAGVLTVPLSPAEPGPWARPGLPASSWIPRGVAPTACWLVTDPVLGRRRMFSGHRASTPRVTGLGSWHRNVRPGQHVFPRQLYAGDSNVNVAYQVSMKCRPSTCSGHSSWTAVSEALRTQLCLPDVQGQRSVHPLP